MILIDFVYKQQGTHWGWLEEFGWLHTDHRKLNFDLCKGVRFGMEAGKRWQKGELIEGSYMPIHALKLWDWVLEWWCISASPWSLLKDLRLPWSDVWVFFETTCAAWPPLFARTMGMGHPSRCSRFQILRVLLFSVGSDKSHRGPPQGLELAWSPRSNHPSLSSLPSSSFAHLWLGHERLGEDQVPQMV